MAIERLRALLEPYAGPGKILPARFLTVTPEDLVLRGWETLGDAVRRRDVPGHLISAISVSFGWAGEEAPGPDAEGRLNPHIEIGYYSDNAFPFSRSTRDDLLGGYSSFGCSWSGDAETTDSALGVDGIDDLHGALANLEAALLASEEPDEDGIRAGSLGSCLLSALLVQAVTDRIAADGLPRPLCVMAGSNDVYPYFDVPVAGMPEALTELEDQPETVNGAPVPRYSSLLMTGIPRAKKRAVLTLEENEQEMADRIARLRHQTLGQEDLPQVQPEPAGGLSDADTDRPLLAKKPVHKTHALAGLGGLVPELDASPEPDWQDWDDWGDPEEPAAPEPSDGKITSFEIPPPGDDLQQRLQSLLAFYSEADTDPEQAAAAPVESSPLSSMPEVEETDRALPEPGLWARVGGALIALLSRLRR
ncbi:MAG TPA: hypothetical protein PK479_08915 [Novosphingobium sp.]|nr:hypothetical protein [Novosphingobium sp.]HNN56277.1 hypothetical protein [Novosphingobium sp.]